MKKVIIHPEQLQTVSIDSITNNSIVGIDWNSHKTWVIETKGQYCSLRIGDKTLAHKWEKPSIKDYCSEAIKIKAEVFVFDTEAELVKWLKS